MRRTLVTPALLGGLAATLVLAGCGSSTSGSDSSGSGGSGGSASSGGSDFKLAGVLANTSDPFWASIGCGAQEQAKKLGAELDLYTSTSTDNAQIANNFQSATLKNPDGLFVNPFNPNQFVAQYKSMMQQGTPVVTASSTTPRTEYQVVFSDTETAQFADEALKDVPPGSGSMVFMGGAPGIPPLEARTQPFVEAVQKARPDLVPLDTEYSGFDINKATTDAASLIIGHPDLKLIIAADGPDAVGAAAAIDQAGKSGQITLIGFDAVPPEVEALKKGTISALIAQNPFEIGRQQVGALVDYLKDHKDGGPVPTNAEPIGIPNKLLTADTADDPANADYVYKPSC
jgi:ribose transport system substrate-binding protein